MNYLSAEFVGKSYSDNWLFKDLSIGISQGQKIALVGNNGTGKTTLLKILTQEIEPDSGSVSKRDGVRIGYLTQQPAVKDGVTVRDLLFNKENELAKVVQEYEDCLSNPDVSSERMQKALENMGELNAWDYEAKVKEVIGKLGVPELDKTFVELSGGQKKRIFLAQLLLTEPDLLILDEPTNHLDLSAIEWLETFLSGQQITLIMVTHDRYFLDNVVNEIVELDRGKLFHYKGNYAYFLEKKAEREEILKAEVSKAKNLLKKELEWMRRQPKARGTKAKYRIDAFFELKDKASQDIKKDKLELDIKQTRQGGKILEVENISKSFENLTIVNQFTYVFKKNDRIGIIGPNGIGKSTFLDLLTGLAKQDSGEIIPGLTTRFGYFTQESIKLNTENRLIEEVKEIAEYVTLSDGSQVSASKFLDSFLFPPEKQYTFINKLSGGEKKRLQLLKLLVTNPNFLILDEPTNDFDIDTLNVLEDFLQKFKGCLLLVSHDRYFMDQLVDQLFVFEGNGEITFFPGNYSDYRSWKEDQETAGPKIEKEKEVQPKIEVTETRKTKMSYKDKQEFDQLLPEIDKLEKRKLELIEKLSKESDDHQVLTDLSMQIKVIEAEIEEKTLRWMSLSELSGQG